MCEMRHWLTGLAFGLKRDERLSLKSSHMLVCLKHNQGLENTDDSVCVFVAGDVLTVIIGVRMLLMSVWRVCVLDRQLSSRSNFP